MNSKDGGNFCGSKLPHKFCWDFVGTAVAPGSWSDRLKNRRSSNAVQSTASALSAIVTSTTDSLGLEGRHLLLEDLTYQEKS